MQEYRLLEKLEQQMSVQVDHFLVLSEEGDPTQIALAHMTAKNELIKLGPVMQQLAQKIGGDLPGAVADFLESVDDVLRGPDAVTEEQISHRIDTTARLKSKLYRSGH